MKGLNILVKEKILNLTVKKLIELEIAKEILEKERDKRIKPFFDNKVQTDLNCFWLYSNLYSLQF